MEAAQALADLTEISAQIEAAVLAKADGSIVASTMKDEGRAKQLAEAAVELVAAGSESRSEGPNQELVQLQAATPRGSLFVARDESHVVAAITGSRPTVGLVFYDLKTCLRMLEDEEAKADKPARAEKTDKTEKNAPKEKAKVGKGTTRRRTPSKKEADEGS
jgi:predicted regulator of Ras-like GTPase activity (Roadblock/LC7/MglB family)